MEQLTLEKARLIIDGVLARGADLGLQPLGVAVLDAGGHLKAFAAADGSTPGRPGIAQGKAYGAIVFGRGTRRLERLAAERPSFYEALTGIADKPMIPVPGGVAIRSAAGALLGSVGVTGDTADNDEACAIAGVEMAGFVADIG